MKISVVIANHNGEKHLGPCLDSLADQARAPERVIVVDNGSEDGSAGLAKGHRLSPELIELGGNFGFAKAVNAGIKASADCDAVALLNNDARADRGWIKAGEQAMKRFPLVSMFASLMLQWSEREVVDSAGDLYKRDGRPRPRGRGRPAADYSAGCEVLSACAGAAFYRSSLFNEVGLFEESFFSYLEDVDLGLRARSYGHVCLYVPEARVYHLGAGTDLGDRPGGKAVDSAERVRWIARNRLRLLWRNWPAPHLARWAPWLLAGLARSAAYHTLISRQAGPFFLGLVQGLRCIQGDRSYYRSTAPDRSFRENARLMREGELPWPD